MTHIADILDTIFRKDRCDFCADHAPKLCYTDPETGCRYCLPCLVLSTEAWPATEEWPELPPDPGVMQMAGELIALPR